MRIRCAAATGFVRLVDGGPAAPVPGFSHGRLPFFSGRTDLVGQVLAIALITLGLGAALLLAFLEVGLSEERDQAREDERRRRRDSAL